MQSLLYIWNIMQRGIVNWVVLFPQVQSIPYKRCENDGTKNFVWFTDGEAGSSPPRIIRGKLVQNCCRQIISWHGIDY